MSKVIPFGDRILVKRVKFKDVNKRESIIVMTEDVENSSTDMAEVVYVPEHSFADEALIKNAEGIVRSQTKKAMEGDSSALKSLLEFNLYLKIKTLKIGDTVMVGNYVGVDFMDSKLEETLTMIRDHEIMGVIKN